MSHIFAKLKSYQTESNNGKVVISKEEHEEIRTFLKEFAGKTVSELYL